MEVTTISDVIYNIYPALPISYNYNIYVNVSKNFLILSLNLTNLEINFYRWVDKKDFYNRETIIFIRISPLTGSPSTLS